MFSPPRVLVNGGENRQNRKDNLDARQLPSATVAVCSGPVSGLPGLSSDRLPMLQTQWLMITTTWLPLRGQRWNLTSFPIILCKEAPSNIVVKEALINYSN